jgi:hypothetical protein
LVENREIIKADNGNGYIGIRKMATDISLKRKNYKLF